MVYGTETALHIAISDLNEELFVDPLPRGVDLPINESFVDRAGSAFNGIMRAPDTETLTMKDGAVQVVLAFDAALGAVDGVTYRVDRSFSVTDYSLMAVPEPDFGLALGLGVLGLLALARRAGAAHRRDRGLAGLAAPKGLRDAIAARRSTQRPRRSSLLCAASWHAMHIDRRSRIGSRPMRL